MGPSSAFSLAFGILLPASKKLEKLMFLLLFICVVMGARGQGCSYEVAVVVGGWSSTGRWTVVGWSSAGCLWPVVGCRLMLGMTV